LENKKYTTQLWSMLSILTINNNNYHFW
jgi:hypothetical protein